MAAVKKLEDTKFITVIISNRNPESEERSTFCGGNNVIIDGTSEIKHYTIELDEKVSLPEHFVQQLKDRSFVGKDKKTGKTVKTPIFLVEKA